LDPLHSLIAYFAGKIASKCNKNPCLVRKADWLSWLSKASIWNKEIRRHMGSGKVHTACAKINMHECYPG
jgi:hypothetical protein